MGVNEACFIIVVGGHVMKSEIFFRKFNHSGLTKFNV